jgi:hypothetical protein
MRDDDGGALISLRPVHTGLMAVVRLYASVYMIYRGTFGHCRIGARQLEVAWQGASTATNHDLIRSHSSVLGELCGS